MQYLCVTDLEKCQHYKDRSPPWIKLHRDLLRDYRFCHLPDSAKAHLVLLWLLASQMDNRMPNDPKFLQRMIGSTEPPNIKLLIERGFLSTLADCYQDASDMLASRYQVAIVETEIETEIETEADKRAHARTREGFPPEFEEFWNLFPKQRAGSRQNAYYAWERAIKKVSVGTLLSTVAAYAKSNEVARGYAKGAAAWLNDERWTHDYSIIPTTGGTNGTPTKSKYQRTVEAFQRAAASREREYQTGD